MMKKIVFLLIAVIFVFNIQIFAQNDIMQVIYKSGKLEEIKIGDLVKSSLDLYENGSQEFNLNTGWNFISSNIIPLGNDSLHKIFSGVLNIILIIKSKTGQVYIPGFGINQINIWNFRDSYMIYCTTNIKVNIEGLLAKPSKDKISLTTGWNWVSYLRNNPLESPTALASILEPNKLLIAKNYSGQVFIPSFNINSIGNFVQGAGYQMYMQSNATLTYPD